jgi:hypothetical protein
MKEINAFTWHLWQESSCWSIPPAWGCTDSKCCTRFRGKTSQQTLSFCTPARTCLLCVCRRAAESRSQLENIYLHVRDPRDMSRRSAIKSGLLAYGLPLERLFPSDTHFWASRKSRSLPKSNYASAPHSVFAEITWGLLLAQTRCCRLCLCFCFY